MRSDSKLLPGSAAVETIFRDAGKDLTAGQLLQLEEFVRVLLAWNTKVNLISRKDEEHIWRNHILHSLSAVLLCELPSHGTYLDIGTGGGLPGLPLAILLPQAEFVLCDSITKKMNAVRNMTEVLGLGNVRCIISRVEELGRENNWRESFDVVLARAVTRLPDLVRWSSPLLLSRPASRLIVWKGGDTTEEETEAHRVPTVREVTITGFERFADPYFFEQGKKIITVRFKIL